MISGNERWLDRDAGPVVRPYALTRGRTRSRGPDLGLIDLVVAVGSALVEPRRLGPEHKSLLSLCRSPVTVADLASELDLPLGVVRVLLGDLREGGLVRIVGSSGEPTPEESVMRSVLDGLRAL
jgi:DNA-binding transcriptional ArsR family regulator